MDWKQVEPTELVMRMAWEGEYYQLWYEPADRRQPLTPRVSPPPEKGAKPQMIPLGTAIGAAPLFLGPVDAWPELLPRVTRQKERLLRPTGSAMLGPHAYFFCGPVVATDRWGVAGQPWNLAAIVDCGVPLCLSERYRPAGDPSAPVLENWCREGNWLAGLVRLSTMPLVSGLYQPVAGLVQEMRLLDLDPGSTAFGSVVSVPFGTVLPVDPMMVPQDCVFTVLKVEYAGSLVYRALPSRPPECPEPDYPGMERIEKPGGLRVQEVTPGEGNRA